MDRLDRLYIYIYGHFFEYLKKVTSATRPHTKIKNRKIQKSIHFSNKKQIYLYKNSIVGTSRLTNFRFRRSWDLQKSGLGEVRIYKNQVWAKSGLTKIMIGRSQDLQKSCSGEVRTYKNQVWAKSGLTKTMLGRSLDLQE